MGSRMMESESSTARSARYSYLWANYRIPRSVLFLLALIVVMTSLLLTTRANAATPGLPFTEDFTDTSLRDDANTTANWDTVGQALVMQQARRLYAGLDASTSGSNITNDGQVSYSSALGDVDGDGDLDLVVGNSGINKLYLNNGTADPWNGVTSSNITSDSSLTRGIALGDVDGDGDLDVVAANQGARNRLYLNNGTNDPWNGVSGLDITADSHASRKPVFTDFDGDGDLDMAVPNFGERNRLYLNDGSGDPWDTVTGVDITADVYNSDSMVVGDVDTDGDMDVIFGNTNQPDRIYLNNGTLNPFNLVTGSNISDTNTRTKGIAMGDVDGDGSLDLVVATDGFQINYIYLNNGTADPFNGVAETVVSNDAHDSIAIALGDVNSDGALDVIVGNDGGGAVNRLYLNNGTSAPFDNVAGTNMSDDTNITYGLTMGDVDQDGDTDIISVGDGVSRLYLNTANPNPWNGVSGSNLPAEAGVTTAVAFGDLNGDGFEDLVVGNSGGVNRIYIHNGTSDPWAGVAGVNLTSDSFGTHELALHDFDRDGDIDILVGNLSGRNRYYENDGSGTNWSASGSDVTNDAHHTTTLAVGDIDGDGDLDFVAGNTWDDVDAETNRLYLNNGTTDPWSGISGSDITSDAHLTHVVALGDVDGDGDLDVLAGNSTPDLPRSEQPRLYLNDGSGTPWVPSWIASNLINEVYFMKTLSLGDVDRDGDLDLLAFDVMASQLKMYRNEGAGLIFSTSATENVGPTPRDVSQVALVDLNGDGNLDVATASPNNDDFMILSNGTSDPFNGIATIPLNGDVDETKSFALGDIDRDGDLDYVAGNLALGAVDRSYLSTAADHGGLHPWNANAVVGSDIGDDSLDRRGAALGDVDGDGHIDMVVARINKSAAGATNLLYLNNGTSTPWEGVTGLPITSDLNQSKSMALGDVDGDGDLDLVVGNDGDGAGEVNRLYLNDGAGDPWDTVSGIDIVAADAHDSYDMLLGDVDRDGDLDLIAINHGNFPSGEPNRLYLNDGSGDPWDTLGGVDITSDVSSSQSGALGDVNGDGYLDLVVGNLAGPAVKRLYLNDGSGDPWDTVSGVNITADIIRTTSVALGDVDGDGDLDLVAGAINDPGGEVNRLYLNDGSGDPWDTASGVVISADSHVTHSVALADIDADGDLDMVAGNANANSPGAVNRLYFNNGTTSPFAGVQGIDITSETLMTKEILVADVNGDGALDIVTSNMESDPNRLYVRDTVRNTASAHATSIKVNDAETGIQNLGFDASAVLAPHTSAEYWLSNDGGATWLLTEPNSNVQFAAPGSDIRWRVNLNSLSPKFSPQINSVDVFLNLPAINPPVPNIETEQDTATTYDLTSHENDAEDSGANLSWSISGVNAALYSASVDNATDDVLTITPQAGQSGQDTATLTLTDSDSLIATQDILVIIGAAGPTPPTAFIFPLAPLETEDLVCAIVFEGTVADGITPQYEYTWSNSIDPPVVNGPSTNTADVLSTFHTEAGDVWTCTIRTYDGSQYSSPSLPAISGQVLALGGSALTLTGTPDTITLGQSVTLSGAISPAVQGANVFFDASETPPGGPDNKPPTQVTDFAGAFVDPFLPDEAGSWALHGEWLGDETYTGNFDVASITVLKAQPTVTLDLNTSSGAVGLPGLAPNDVLATVSLTAALPAELQSLLSGLPVQIFLRKPDGSSVGPVPIAVKGVPTPGITDSGGVATFLRSDFTTAGIDFTEPGTWQLIAEFAGNSNFSAETSAGFDQPDSARLTVKDGTGYAIITVGKLNPAGEGLSAHNKTGDSVYRSFRDRGFDHGDIFYLRQGTNNLPGDILEDSSFDSTPSQAEFRTAIETWAKDAMNVSAAPLYIVMVGHGLPNAYFLYLDTFGETRIITPFELETYVTTLEGNLDAEAQDELVTIVYGACNSGSFINALSDPGHIVITSASSTQKSHRGTRDRITLVRDGELFTSELFRNLSVGKNMKESFELASSRVEDFTLSRSNRAFGSRVQTPLLDDNGDGHGSPSGQLSFTAPGDGATSFGVTLGFGLNAGDSLSWIEATQTLTFDVGESVGQLFARSQTPVPANSTAWMEVKAPVYSGATRVDDTDAENQQEFLDLAQFDFELGISDTNNGIFRWETFGAIFDAPGTYQVYYFVKDGDTGEVSAHLLTTIFRQDGNLDPPTAPDLVFPGDEATIGTTSFFVWTESVDDDGDVTYTIELALEADTAFNTILVQREGITGTFVKLSEVDGILDGENYRWRVRAVDIFGNSQVSTSTLVVHVDQDNSDAPSSIQGKVSNLTTGDDLEDATVTMSGAADLIYDTTSNGEFVFTNLEASLTYHIDVSATGFKDLPTQTIFLPASGADVDLGALELEPDSGVFTWGELNDDGRVGLLDGVDILHWLADNTSSFFFAVDPTKPKPLFAPGADVNGNGDIDPGDTTQFLLREVSHVDYHFLADCDPANGLGPEDSPCPPPTKDYAKDQHTRIVSAPDGMIANPGDTVTVPILIDDAENVTGYILDLTYDTTVLSYMGFTAGDLTSEWLVVENATTLGQVILVAAGIEGTTGTGALANFTFIVNDNTEGLTGALTLIRAQLNDPVGTTIPTSAQHGSVEVPGENTNDVNNDGSVNASDIQLVINAVLGLTTSGNPDVNGDDSTDAADIQLVINQVLGVEPAMVITGE
jgi:hypothetical protein